MHAPITKLGDGTELGNQPQFGIAATEARVERMSAALVLCRDSARRGDDISCRLVFGSLGIFGSLGWV